MDIAPQLQSALRDERSRLTFAASAAARAQTGLGGKPSDITMAGLAQSAIFTEAVMSAMHARLEELKAVSK